MDRREFGGVTGMTIASLISSLNPLKYFGKLEGEDTREDIKKVEVKIPPYAHMLDSFEYQELMMDLDYMAGIRH